MKINPHLFFHLFLSATLPLSPVCFADEEPSVFTKIKEKIKSFLPAKTEDQPKDPVTPLPLPSDTIRPPDVLLNPPAPSVFSGTVTVFFSMSYTDPSFKEFRFSLDGTEPTCQHGLLGEKVQLSLTTTLKVIACDQAGNTSPHITGGTYTQTTSVDAVPSPKALPEKKVVKKDVKKIGVKHTKTKEVIESATPSLLPPPAVTLLPKPPVSFESSLVVSFELSSSHYEGFKEFRYTWDGKTDPRCKTKDAPNGIGMSAARVILRDTTTLRVIACSNAGIASKQISEGQYKKTGKEPSLPELNSESVDI